MSVDLQPRNTLRQIQLPLGGSIALRLSIDRQTRHLQARVQPPRRQLPSLCFHRRRRDLSQRLATAHPRPLQAAKPIPELQPTPAQLRVEPLHIRYRFQTPLHLLHRHRLRKLARTPPQPALRHTLPLSARLLGIHPHPAPIACRLLHHRLHTALSRDRQRSLEHHILQLTARSQYFRSRLQHQLHMPGRRKHRTATHAVLADPARLAQLRLVLPGNSGSSQPAAQKTATRTLPALPLDWHRAALDPVALPLERIRRQTHTTQLPISLALRPVNRLPLHKTRSYFRG